MRVGEMQSLEESPLQTRDGQQPAILMPPSQPVAVAGVLRAPAAARASCLREAPRTWSQAARSALSVSPLFAHTAVSRTSLRGGWPR